MFVRNKLLKGVPFRRILLTLFLLVCVLFQALPQEKSFSDKLEKLLGSGKRREAQTLLAEWSKTGPGTAGLLTAWAQFYASDKNYRLALLFLNQAMEKLDNPDVSLWILLGEIQQKSNLFSEAAVSYKKALSLDGKQKQVPARIRQCELGEKLKSNPGEVRITNAGNSVNTPADERRPFPSDDFLRMLFGRMEQAPMQAVGNHGQWEQVSFIPIVGATENNFRFSGCSRDGKLLFLESTSGKGDLYISTFIKGKWSDPDPFPWNAPAFRDYSASVSADGNLLFFVSDRGGNPDIWFSRRSGSSWAKPQKAGPEVNTREEEESPWMDADGQYLYFSSRGHEGLGGFDVFRVPFGRKGVRPDNIGYPLNTAADDLDFMLMPDEKTAFYVSNREGGQGGFDVLMVKMGITANTRLVLFKGTVADAYGTPLDATVTITEVGQSKPASNLKANKETGTFVTLLPSGTNYSVQVEKEGYLFYSENLNFQQGAPEMNAEMKVRLQKLLPGTTLVLNNIFFDPGKSSLRKESSPELQKLLLILRQNPGIRAEISGHMEPGGPEDVLVKITENRAQAVVDYLVATGIKSTRLLARGYGSSKSGDKADKISANRTEFRILSIQ